MTAEVRYTCNACGERCTGRYSALVSTPSHNVDVHGCNDMHLRQGVNHVIAGFGDTCDACEHSAGEHHLGDGKCNAGLAGAKCTCERFVERLP